MVYDYKRKKRLQTIRIVPDDYMGRDQPIVPSEKPNKTIGRPVVPFRKVSQWHCLHLKNWLPMEDAAKRVWFRFNMP